MNFNINQQILIIMKDYVKENQRILDEWCAKFVEDKKSDEAYVGLAPEKYFAMDGIMNKGEFYVNDDEECRRGASGTENESWGKAPIKVLFLSKDQNAFEGEAKDVRTETFHIKGLTTPIDNYQISDSFFYQNEACLLYRLMNIIPQSDLDQITEFSWEEAVKFSDEQIFARINCKKEVGGGSCNNGMLQNAIDEYGDFLKNQINNLDADILICCGRSKQVEATHNVILNYLNTIGYHFEKVEGVCSDEIYYDRANNKVAFNIYHLSYFRYNWITTIKAYYEFMEKYPVFHNLYRK